MRGAATLSEPGPLVQRHGSAKHPDRPVAHLRPPGVSDRAAEALGKLGEALECAEHARGHLYGFHRLSGSADLMLQEAVGLLREAGYAVLAGDIDQALVGRDVIDGRWSFELVELYNRGYYSVFKDAERTARAALGVPDQHLYEAEMKDDEQDG